MKLFSLTFILLTLSCATGKRVRLKSFSYKLSDEAGIAVNYLKRTEQELEFSLLGISLDREAVAVKVSDVECGAGDVKFEKLTINGDEDGILIFPKNNYHEFSVSCLNNIAVSDDEKPYLLFKKTYKYSENKLNEVVEEEIKIKFE